MWTMWTPPPDRKMSIEYPENLDEWRDHIAGLSGDPLRSKAIAANSYRFVQTLQEEGYGPQDIDAIFKMIARQFVATGQEPTSMGYVDYRQIVIHDPELNSLYESLDDGDDMTRQRLTATLAHKWGPTMTPDETVAKIALSDTAKADRLDVSKVAGRAPSGMYGYPKKIEARCLAAQRKMKKAAIGIIKNAYQKDAKVIDFLMTHKKRAKSTPARVLLAAMKEAHSVFASMGIQGGRVDKEAGRTRYGLYGFRARTAALGLSACQQMREQAGIIAADLHARKAKQYERITGFLDAHSKKARCGYTRMLRLAYPDQSMKLASGEPVPVYREGTDGTPDTVDGWLTWED